MAGRTWIAMANITGVETTPAMIDSVIALSIGCIFVGLVWLIK